MKEQQRLKKEGLADGVGGTGSGRSDGRNGAGAGEEEGEGGDEDDLFGDEDSMDVS